MTSYLEDIALLQRGTGECLISIATRPNVSEEILANCGVLITFKNHMQRSFICELLNMDEEKEDYLSILEEGECIVRTNSIKRPFLLWVPLVERYWLKRGDVNRKNKLILKKFKEKDSEMIKNKETSNKNMDKSEKSSQKIQSTECKDEDISDAAEIKFFIDNLLRGDENAKEKFNPENYRKCPECFSIIETKHKICPYCGSCNHKRS